MSRDLDCPVQTQMAVAVLDRSFSSEYPGGSRTEGRQLSWKRVFVQTDNGSVLGIELERGENVQTVKKKLQIALNMPTDESSLTFGDLVLNNDLSSIRNDSPLLLTKSPLFLSGAAKGEGYYAPTLHGFYQQVISCMAGDRMNPAISCSLGAMGTVLGQLDKLNKSGKVLPRGINKRDLEGLIEDLKQISTSAMDLLKEEDPSFMEKCWLKEVREICYDVEDYLHTVFHNSTGVRKMKLRRLIAEDISDLRARLHGERKRRDRCELLGLRARLQQGPTDTGFDFETAVKSVLQIPPAVLDECLNELVDLLAFDSEKQLKIVPILGDDAGVGKTMLARRLYHHYGERFHCRAFLRVSRNPDTRRLLTSLLSQIKAPQHHGYCDVQELSINVNKHLRGKTYLIVVDELWATSEWDIIARAFPDDNCYSRIVTTTQIEDVALACCSFFSNNMYEMRSFSYNQPQQLFFSTTKGMKEVISLVYNDLPDHLKTCLLYFNMYPEDYVVQKDDLVKQWVAEGFVSQVEGQDTEELAERYFDELLNRGMIQPAETNYNNEVLSCTVHQIVLDLLACKSREENFITVVEYFDTVTGFSDNVRRLTLKFGGAEGAQIPENFRMSQVRSLLFSGFFRCMPSIQKYMLLRVLILHVWADHDKKSFDLTRICELFLLRYLKIECNIPVKLPEQMKGLQCLETLEVEARIDVFPKDIFSLQCLSHLHLPGCTEMPHGIRSMTSLRTLRYFNLNTSSGDNLLELAKLTNLQDLHILCSTALSNCLISNLASVLGKISNLRSLVLDSGASSGNIISTDGLSCMYPAPVLLETFDLSPQVCIVSSLPRWFRELRKLRILRIALQELSSDTVNIIKGLPALASLSIYVRMAPAQKIVFNDEFTVLKHFKFICPALCVAFTEGAMHTLQRLKLGFNANTMKQFSPVDAGFNHLTGLEVFSVKIGSAGADESGRGAIQFTLQDAFTQHPSRPVINIQWVDLIFGIDTVQQADSRIVLPPGPSTSLQKEPESSPLIQKRDQVEDNKTRIQEENYEVLGTKETRRQQENPENVAQWKTRILEQDMDEPQGSPVNEFGENRKSEYLTCRSSTVHSSHVQNTDEVANTDMQALYLLSDSFAKAFESPNDFLADVRITVPGARELWAHQCVLCMRSPFLRAFFVSRASGSRSEVDLRELLGEEVEVWREAVQLVLKYMYSGRVGDLPKAACTCVDEDGCAHVGCRPAVAFMTQVMFIASTFQIAELTNLFQGRLLHVLDSVEVDNLPLILSVANLCNKTCMKLLERCLYMVARSNLDMITLEKGLPPVVTKQIFDARISLGLVSAEDNGFPNINVRRIYRALDSDDVELVRMLLKEGNTNLDEAYALHYAVQHCDQKITTELLDLTLADVNHRNTRGYTVLHVAAVRREPTIIVSLLIMGARPSDLTFDQRKAVQISRRLTKHGDYSVPTEDWKYVANKDRLCIEILEQAEEKSSQLGEASVSLAVGADSLRGRLMYLENRVALAGILFPLEAKVAMDIAQVDKTEEFACGSRTNQTEEIPVLIDLNDVPFKLKEGHLARMIALKKTVELGKRFFPRCSKVLDKIMDDETEIAALGRDTSTEKKRRFHDIQDLLQNAFREDKDALDKRARQSNLEDMPSAGPEISATSSKTRSQGPLQ